MPEVTQHRQTLRLRRTPVLATRHASKTDILSHRIDLDPKRCFIRTFPRQSGDAGVHTFPGSMLHLKQSAFVKGIMNRNSTILITGASGMVGSALVRRLQADGFRNVLAPGRSELDLCDTVATDRYFLRHRPEYAFLMAAKVGGIAANVADPVGFLSENLAIANNCLSACHRFGIRKSVLLGSSCIYPRLCPQPIQEGSLLTGQLEPTNEGYAIAKIAALKLAQSYHIQYGMQTVCPMPCNIYGTGDHFDLQRSHVLSALVRRFCDARDERQSSIRLWGTGSARREFIHVDDVVDGILFLQKHVSSPEIINLGTGADITIRELAECIGHETGYQGQIEWDHSMPDGMPRKCLDCNKLNSMGFRPGVSLLTGIRRTIAEYRDLKDRGRIAA
jgi:GDP-L-fucose synthase